MKYATMMLTLLLAGCAATASNWSRPGTTAAQTQYDMKACAYEAEKATPREYGDPIATGISEGMRQVRLRDQCLELRGYQRR